MEVPGLPSQVHGGVGSKRRLNPEDDTPTKRRKRPPANGEMVTRRTTSGEDIWGPSYLESLFLSEEDKPTFCIQFKGRRNETSASEAKSPSHTKRRSIVKELTHYGEATLKGMTALLESYGLRPRHPELHLRYQGLVSVVDADGHFRRSSTRSSTRSPTPLDVAFVEFAKMAQRRTKHLMALLPQAKKEEKKFGKPIAEELRRIEPEKAEEDAQIALVMAAVAQKMLRSADRKQREQRIGQKQPTDQKQPGAWARVIGIGGGKIYMYRSWVPRRSVETFKAEKRFVIEYRSVSLKDEDRVIEQLDCLLKDRSPPNVRSGTAVVAS